MQKKKILLALFLMLLLVLFIQLPSFSASYSVNVSKSTLNYKGTTTLTITTKDCGGQFEITSSDSSIVGVNEKAVIWVDDNATGSLTLSAKEKAGKVKITVNPLDVSDKSGFNAITNKQTKEITVTAPSSGGTNTNTSKSSDATLKSITVGGKTYSKPSTSITAPNASSDTSSIKISATVNNSKAKVSGTGTKDLKTGTNKFTLKVTAENGNTKTYTITVVRLAEESEEPNLPDEEKPEVNLLKLASLQIEGAELSPDFKDDVYEYSTYIFDLDEVKINAVANDPEAKVEITGNTNLVDGENIVVIKLTKGETSVEYKVKVNKMQLEPLEETQDSNIEEEPKTSKIAELWNRYGLIMIVYSTILISTGVAIGFGITNYKNSDKTKKEKPISKHSRIDFKKEDNENTKNDKNF